MPEMTGNWVHLMYLTMLADLDKEMCRATDPDAKTMGDCVSLLQSQAWYCMPFIATRVTRTPSYPLVMR